MRFLRDLRRGNTGAVVGRLAGRRRTLPLQSPYDVADCFMEVDGRTGQVRGLLGGDGVEARRRGLSLSAGADDGGCSILAGVITLGVGEVPGRLETIKRDTSDVSTPHLWLGASMRVSEVEEDT